MFLCYPEDRSPNVEYYTMFLASNFHEYWRCAALELTEEGMFADIYFLRLRVDVITFY